jgi:hypothetical protein
MKKWEVVVEFMNHFVELPDDAVVIQYENDVWFNLLQEGFA